MKFSVLVKSRKPLSERVIDLSNSKTHHYRSKSVEIEVSKRALYPNFYFSKHKDKFLFGYGKQKPSNSDYKKSEFLACEYDNKSGKITILRDAFCTMPIFYYSDEAGFFLSNNYSDLIKHLRSEQINLTLDIPAIKTFLVMPTFGVSTLVKGVKLVAPLTALTWENGKTEITNQHQPINYKKLGADPKDFKTALDETLEQNYKKIIDSQRLVSFEASGGLDSATAPLLYSYKFDHKPECVVLTFDRELGRSQESKLADLQRTTKGNIKKFRLDPNRLYPLIKSLSATRPIPQYQYSEIYSSAVEDLANYLSKSGMKFVFTGLGGDDLFENRPDDVQAKHYESLSCFTDKLINQDCSSRLLSNQMPIATSSFMALQSRNSIYIDRDIWPISPLVDPKLYAFCQALPIVARDNKNILRAYHQAYGWPESIYNPDVNENFGEFFDKSTRANYSKYFGRIINTNSWLAKNNFIDLGKTKELFEQALDIELDPNGEKIFLIYRILKAELTIRGVYDTL